MEKLFTYAKYAAFALIAVLVVRLAVYNLHSFYSNIILDVTGAITTLLLLGYFLGLITNSKKGSPIKIPSAIGAAGEILGLISVIIYTVFSVMINADSSSEVPFKLLKTANSLDFMATVVCAGAFIYLSLYFGKKSSPRFAAWTIAAIIVVNLILWKTVKYWEWEDKSAGETYNLIHYYAFNVLSYGSYIWFLLGFSNLKQK